MIKTDDNEPIFGECLGAKGIPVDPKRQAASDFCAYTAYHAARAEAEAKTQQTSGYKTLRQRRREASRRGF
jgi:hypothetical protein